MSSLRIRLFAILALVTLIVWGGAAAWVETQTRAEVQQVLDRRLMESARMVSSLVRAGSLRPSVEIGDAASGGAYDRQLSCQIWSLDGALISRSQSAPAERLSEGRDGFSERGIGGERWRVYTVQDQAAGFQVMVGDNLSVRDHLVGSVVNALIGPAVIGLLLLGLLIWWSLGRGLAPIRQMTQELAERGVGDLTAIEVTAGAGELRPFVLALNDLMARLDAARRREVEFIAAAAHELRTPLAGLRVQAQIAAITSEALVRDHALKQIQTSVDRTARLAAGLLALAREDEVPVAHSDRRWVSLRSLFIAADGDPRVGFIDEDMALNVDPDRFGAAAGNLLANAQAHARTTITIAFEEGLSSPRLVIEDDGPGVAAQDLACLGRRFFRAPGAPAGGSGLGLSIVLATVKAHGGETRFLRGGHGGLRIEILLPEDQFRRP